MAPAAAGLGCPAKVAVVPDPVRGLVGLQVRPALCAQGGVRADGRFYGHLATWRLSGWVRDQPAPGSSSPRPSVELLGKTKDTHLRWNRRIRAILTF